MSKAKRLRQWLWGQLFTAGYLFIFAGWLAGVAILLSILAVVAAALGRVVVK